MKKLRLTLLAGSALTVTPALAQEASPPAAPPPAAESPDAAPAEGDAQEIVVVATRIKGQVETEQPPVATLDEKDIASYGATSVADLLDALSPQTGSGRGRGGGRPVILVNGQRIGSFREMRNYPPEAIKKVEILPEEVATKFGYAPDQRVVNFILKDNYAATTVQVGFSAPQRGGTSTATGEASLLTINGPARFNLTAKADHTSLLTESERNILQTAGSQPTVSGDPDPAAARSLTSRATNYSLDGSWSRALGSAPDSGTVTLTGGVDRTYSRGLSGLDTVALTDPFGTTAVRTFGDPLARKSRSTTLEGAATLNKPLGKWNLTVTADGNHAVSDTLTDRRADTAAIVAAAAAGNLVVTGPLPSIADAGTDRAHTVTNSANSLATLSGRPFELPAGPVATTLKAGYSYDHINSDNSRSTTGAVSLSRGDLQGGFNVALPIASRRRAVLEGVGDLTLNLSGGFNYLSDFGTIYNYNTGLTWGVTPKLSLGASYIYAQAAPSLSQLGAPQIQTFNVPTYDFATGRNVLVTTLTGGNPSLLRETRKDIKLSANWQLPILTNSRFVAEYFRNSSDNVTESFPFLTPAVEAAFPGRVTRDAAGNLVSIDRRPVTFAHEESSRLRYGFNLSGSLGTPPQGGGARQGGGGMAGARAGGPPTGGFGGGGGRGGAGGGGGSRWNLGLFHTIQFTNTARIGANGPVLDLLDGDALTGGGVSRHTFELDAGAFYNGFGLRLNGSYASPTDVKSSGLPGSSDLHFGGLAKLNARVFANLGQQKSLVDAVPFFANSRLTLRVDNLLNTHQKVTDSTGAIPISYQPDLVDPLGRVFGIEFRKQF